MEYQDLLAEWLLSHLATGCGAKSLKPQGQVSE